MTRLEQHFAAQAEERRKRLDARYGVVDSDGARIDRAMAALTTTFESLDTVHIGVEMPKDQILEKGGANALADFLEWLVDNPNDRQEAYDARREALDDAASVDELAARRRKD